MALKKNFRADNTYIISQDTQQRSFDRTGDRPIYGRLYELFV